MLQILLLAFIAGSAICQTPVIGGTCKLGTADVQIGGKQTQFFLKCETTADSADGEGVWVVKSRAAAGGSSAPAASAAPNPIPFENTQPQQHPKTRKPASPNICEQDNGARETESCAVSATCLQAHNEYPSSYLQCDQTTLRWVRKSCQEGFLFNFEQQTCIVPKRMSSLSQNITNLSLLDPCSVCQLGTACRNGICIPLTTSSLCSDGSPPNGTCMSSTKCMDGHFCTAQKVCCPKSALHSSIGCQLVCTISESCPKGMTCQNNCCEMRKILRHPKIMAYGEDKLPTSIFEASNDIFDSAAVELFVASETQKSQKPLVEEASTPSTPSIAPSKPSKPEEIRCLSNELTSGFSCGGTNANCTSDDDCPSSFKCEKSCCRLSICPRTETPVRFTCTSQYHCRASETCVFGGCCPKVHSVLAVASPVKSTMMTTTAEPGSCEVDNRVSPCNIDNPCPEMSECIGSVCCKQPPSARCGNGLMALSIPQFCDLTEDCPLLSRCEYGKCCPLLTEGPSDQIDDGNNDVIQKEITSTSTKVWRKTKSDSGLVEGNSLGVEQTEDSDYHEDTIKLAEEFKKSSKVGVSINKNKCLSSVKCNLHTLCPPDFTCSLSGKCCKMDIRCSDGTVPETSCDPKSMDSECPSSNHKCTLLGDKYHACCYQPDNLQFFFDANLRSRRLSSPSSSSDSSDCPPGSSEVDPRFGTKCHYSLQCPSPFFCNQKGKCCQVLPESKNLSQQANGLLCTFSSCSNSNPCSVGTCNNGYCCSSSGSSSPSIIENSHTTALDQNRTTTTNLEKRKKSKSSKKATLEENDKKFETLMNDFPVGPPGYGFPEHLVKLDEVLVKASGDGNSCAGGFTSSLICSIGSECPAGLHCDLSINLCCPLILPLTDPKNPKKKSKRRKQTNFSGGEKSVPAEGREENQNNKDGTRNNQFSSYACGCMASSGSNNNCQGCQSAPQIITIPQNNCPGGGYSVGGCSSGYCATGYNCIQNQCCPSYNSAPQVSVYTCPSGGSAVGACISGQCASGYQCYNNGCCPQTTTTNPFVCPDGTQAAGGCVNGLCGTGYTCSNGLCCAGTSTTVRCLDGSDAVGACIPSCQGDGCGGVQVSYYCGSGYTCTTGNICCPINSCPNGGEPLGPTINGLCPTGYTVQGSLCCSATCADGTAGTASINGICPTGTTLTNGVCCAGAGLTCTDDISIGPCLGTGFNNGCPVGYACDVNQVNCCPVVDYTSAACIVGPGVGNACPPGFAIVFVPNTEYATTGACVDLQCTTGLCAAANQIGDCAQDTATGTCPAGFTCFTNAGICCTTTMSRLRPSARGRLGQQAPAYGTPLQNYMPPRFGSIPNSCADGSVSSGPCMNGLCGIGLECQHGQCCQPSKSGNNQLQSICPSGDTAVSGCFPNGSCGTGFECVSSLKLCCPPGQPRTPSFPTNNNNNNNNRFGSMSSPRPIGARCQYDGECVGQNEGLSMCHAGVCQCSPIAYTQGIACVRRKSFQMNDEPVIDAIDDKSSNGVAV